MEQRCGAAAVELGRAAAVADRGLAGRLDEVLGAGDLAVEVARVEFGAPDRLVDRAQLGDREVRRAERGRQRGVLQLGPGPLEAVGQDLGVVEGQAVAGRDRAPRGAAPRRCRPPGPAGRAAAPGRRPSPPGRAGRGRARRRWPAARSGRPPGRRRSPRAARGRRRRPGPRTPARSRRAAPTPPGTAGCRGGPAAPGARRCGWSAAPGPRVSVMLTIIARDALSSV